MNKIFKYILVFLAGLSITSAYAWDRDYNQRIGIYNSGSYTITVKAEDMSDSINNKLYTKMEDNTSWGEKIDKGDGEITFKDKTITIEPGQWGYFNYESKLNHYTVRTTGFKKFVDIMLSFLGSNFSIEGEPDPDMSRTAWSGFQSILINDFSSNDFYLPNVIKLYLPNSQGNNYICTSNNELDKISTTSNNKSDLAFCSEYTKDNLICYVFDEPAFHPQKL